MSFITDTHIYVPIYKEAVQLSHTDRNIGFEKTGQLLQHEGRIADCNIYVN